MLSKALSLAAAGAAGAETDEYFDQTVLLLHGDGTNGAENETFQDSSSNGFTVTPNGNPMQGAFSPFSTEDGRWSNYVVDTRTSWPAAVWSGLSGSTFTVEYWIYPIANGGIYGGTVLGINKSGRTDSVFLYHSSTGTVGITTAGSSVFTSFGTTDPIPLHQWTHFALTVSGSSGSAVGKIYINGTLVKTQNSMNTGIPDLGVGAFTGTRGDGTQYNLRAYLSNLRIVKDQVLYTGDFTPATSPLTTNAVGTSGPNVASSITGTVHLLTYQNKRFENLGTSGAITSTSSALRPFSPFAPSSAYDISVSGASAYFNGSSYFSLSNTVNLRPEAGDFTMEAWIYKAGAFSGVDNATIYGTWWSGGTPAGGWIWFLQHSTGQLHLAFWNVIVVQTAAGAIKDNQWMHVAVTKSGTTTRLFLDGVVVSTNASDTYNYNNSAYPINIGRYNDPNSSSYQGFLNGYISNFRFVKGQALATGNFTPPTAPVTRTEVGWTGANAATSLTGTVQLLLTSSNVGIYDLTGKNVLETVADARIATGTKKYGTGSMQFDGNGDYLLVPHSVDQMFGTGKFTIEMWVYRNTTELKAFIGKGVSGSTGWSVGMNSSGKVVFYYGNTSVASSNGFSLSTWTHIAVVREGTGANQTKIYINGTQDNTLATVSTDFNQTEAMYIGSGRGGNDQFNGFIDDLRLTRGVARYLANFTPPTKAFPDQ